MKVQSLGLVVLLLVGCGEKGKGKKNGEEQTAPPAPSQQLAETKTDKTSPITAIFSIIQDGVCLEYDANYQIVKSKVQNEVKNNGGSFQEGPCATENASGRCTMVDAGSSDDLDHVSIKGTTSMVFYWTKPREEVQKLQQEDCLKASAGVTSTYVRY